MSHVRVWLDGASRRRSSSPSLSLRSSVVAAGGVLTLALLPSPASAFTAAPSGASTVIATGDAADDVSVSRAPDGRVVVEVFGQDISGAAPAGCAWDADLQQLACDPATRLDVRLGGGDDSLDVTGDVPVAASGESGNDGLQAGTGAVAFDGGDGNDTLTGGGGADGLTGGGGDDAIDAGAGADVVDAGDGADVVDGGAGDDTLRGGGGNDQLNGTSGNDTVDGGDGNDTIEPGSGASTTSGGAGDDQLSLSAAAGGSASAGDGNDTIDATDATGGVSLDGGTGNDVLSGGAGADGLQGGPGDDVLAGGAGGDRLGGGDGSDRVVFDDAGAVTVTVGGGADDGRPGEGDDVQADVEQVDGTSDDDLLVAGPAGTILGGLDGDDVLSGRAGSDQLLGGPGRDRLDGGAGVVPDVFEGGPDVDEVSYAGRAEPLAIELGSRDAVSGAAGERDRFVDPVENVVGGSAGDRIVGQPGIAHRIDSGAGDDTVVVRELLTQRSDTATDGVQCGDGTDRVESDRFDTVAVSCERVVVDTFLRRPEMIYGRNTQKVTISKGGRVARIRVGCDHQTRGYCATRVLLRDTSAKTNLARREIRIMPGKTAVVRVRAANDRRARKLGRRSKILVVVAARDKVGNGSISKLVMKTRQG